MNCFLLLLVKGLLVTLVLGDDCPYQECPCFQQNIYCNDRYLKQMPLLLFKNSSLMMVLNLNSNFITTVPVGSLPANISGLYMMNNPVETIDDAAFDESVYTLQELSFSQSRFTQLPKAVLHLKNLKRFRLYNINILAWKDEAMKLFGPTMDTLSLDTLGLTIWPTWIKSMANLTKLTVSGNFITFIPDDALDMMAETLGYLDLFNNSLTTLPKSLTKMTALSSLSLDYNRLVDVTWLPQLSNLLTLSLTNNKITDAQKLSSAVKHFAGTLMGFAIHDNSLTSIPELSFMSKITILDFTFNHISDSNSGSVPAHLSELKMDNNFLPSIPRIMTSLNRTYTLYLNSNNIRTIQGTEFPPKLGVVDLGSNLISQLSRSSFPENSQINSLTLSNNPLSTISTDAFINLPSITQLFLKQTKLTRLPLAIASLTKLYLLDVSDNRNLVCTCQEQRLQARIQAMETYYMKGDCGETSVYFFFKNLSPLCPPLF